MPLSTTVTAAAAPARTSPDRAPGAGAPTPGGGHVHAGAPHADPHHADHVHVHGGAKAPSIRIGASVLRLSLGARLLLAGGLLALLWTAVALVVGSEP